MVRRRRRLSTACGGSDAIWIREVLPVGWGDTYYQYVAGQSFDITHLPNGRYYVQVQANPTGSMIETTQDNNASLRRVILRGQAGEPPRRRAAVHGHRQRGVLVLLPVADRIATRRRHERPAATCPARRARA